MKGLQAIYRGNIMSEHSESCCSYKPGKKEDINVKIQKIREIAKGRGIKAGSIAKVELIRAIQRAEGNRSCFRTEYMKECGQINCLWRDDCLKQA
jgi:hypothetical protein